MAIKRQKHSSVQCEVVEITPTIAAEWLESNTGNFRKIDYARVACYAADIADGLWDMNGESIVFHADGELQNGQHRLEGVVKAKKPIWSVVVRGIRCDAKHTDRGKPRSVAQWIAHSGVTNASTVASVARKCVGYSKGIWDVKGWGVDKMTDNEVIQFAENHHKEITASMVGSRPPHIPLSDMTAVIFTGCGLRDINGSETARWFRDAVVKGMDLADTDAVLHLRNRVAQNGSTKVTAFMTRMFVTLAWNKTVEDAECTGNNFRLRVTGPAKQNLPKEILQVDDYIKF